MPDDLLFDEADRLLIATVRSAVDVGTGRTFETPAGQTCRVVRIESPWVELEVMVNGMPTGETLSLPLEIERIAIATAQYRRSIGNRAARQ